MVDVIYIEKDVQTHPRTLAICERFPRATKISCDRYSQVFNPKAQNFRVQKNNPALILARKHKHFVLPTPQGYGIGSEKNYYFSHMMNCLYDCRYCFLQGMYPSANYVVFVNYEDFQDDIRRIAQDGSCHFFSGYDCDSLAFEPVTQFATEFLEFFAALPDSLVEIRTKSTQIRSLLDRQPIAQAVIAFSLSPDAQIQQHEPRTPSLSKRLRALQQLQQAGWKIGLRFDPVVYSDNYLQEYQALFEQCFTLLDAECLHSVSLGLFRLPEYFHKKMVNLYPLESLLYRKLETKQGTVRLQAAVEQDMIAHLETALLAYIPQSRYFPCYS